MSRMIEPTASKSNAPTFFNASEYLAERRFWADACSPSRRIIIEDSIRQELEPTSGNRPFGVSIPDGSTEIWLALTPPSRTGQSVLIHAARVDPAKQRLLTLASDNASEAISANLEQICNQSSITFLQWATDPDDEPLGPALLGMQHLSTLDYLALEIDDGSENSPPLMTPLQCEPLLHHDATAVAQFESIVAGTYVQTLDCPELETMQTPAEILAGYRQSDAYAPKWWMTVREATEPRDAISIDGLDQSNGDTCSVVGCFILACHGDPTSPVIELVYMGVLPEHRGRQFGAAMLESIIQLARQHHASRLILAVDRRNQPASRIYLDRGMTTLFGECVWGRRL
ncbi:MAG: GNAT family N-acetyltransferase [Planctomycetota bacterium]